MEMEQLYKDHSDRVYSYIYLLVRHKEFAEDLTQETFYKAYKGLNTFNKQASTATWLLKIARNVTYDYFRRKRVIQFFSFDKVQDLESNALSPEGRFEQKEQLARMYDSLRKLKKDYQEVLLLRKIQECSIKETAYILGWTEAKVKMKMTRALVALKKEFHQEGGRANGTIKRIR
ncbi:RNA polymerase sigma factor [Psychrobacillus soli]|uniref:Sigma-70 family RNA polymerase sigma factor n=1 Tax=Psychrobacillus soli TaxID=1543965 RepID=A0A544SNG2_9BACI|nr:sigma-70 family RNA polymerase sigma factor [Psychrobacillus soli]TQR06760.1 sigma-70 family RNA polymerase sigma factor [Psychrobacillus soli]